MNYEHELAYAIREFTSELRKFGRRDSYWKFQIMTALENLQDAVTQNTAQAAVLATAVNTAIERLSGTGGGATDAQLAVIAEQVNANTANATKLSEALNLALNPPAA